MGFSEEPKEENTENQEIERFLETMVEETIENAVEREVEETFLEIAPTQDPGPRFIETPVAEEKPALPEVEVKGPKRHPRNIPRFSRTSK